MPDSTVNTPSQHSLQVYEKTDVGRIRDHNEDSKFSDPEGRFFIVADGMGGHAAGEVASQLAVDEVKARLGVEHKLLDAVGRDPTMLSRPVMTELLKRVARDANTAVRKRTIADPKTKGMGTTLEFVCMTADGAWIAHVGDSRTYLIRSTSVIRLTTDQTVAEQLTKKKREKMTEVLEQWGSVLVEAIGAKPDVNADVIHCELKSGDKLLLCSDGLYEYFPREEEIGEILAIDGSEKGLERLVDLACERGGKDNITGLLVDVIEAPKGAGALSNSKAESALEYDTTVEGLEPVATPAPSAAGEIDSDFDDEEDADDPQDYGIAEAISLVRKLPAEQIELVVKVLRRTLHSAGIRTIPVIRDARAKERRIEHRVAALQKEIDGLEREIADFKEEISDLDADREETSLVKGRLELAMKLDRKDS